MVVPAVVDPTEGLPATPLGEDADSAVLAANLTRVLAEFAERLVQGFRIQEILDHLVLRIVEVLPQVHPTWFFAVPRIWEKLKAGLEAMLGSQPEERRAPAEAALAASLQAVRLRRMQIRTSPPGRVQDRMA